MGKCETRKCIKGCIGDYRFVSSEPLAIGLACSERISDSDQSGFSAKVINWSWQNLVAENSLGNVFDENGVRLEIDQACSDYDEITGFCKHSGNRCDMCYENSFEFADV